MNNIEIDLEISGRQVGKTTDIIKGAQKDLVRGNNAMIVVHGQRQVKLTRQKLFASEEVVEHYEKNGKLIVTSASHSTGRSASVDSIYWDEFEFFKCNTSELYKANLPCLMHSDNPKFVLKTTPKELRPLSKLEEIEGDLLLDLVKETNGMYKSRISNKVIQNIQHYTNSSQLQLEGYGRFIDWNS